METASKERGGFITALADESARIEQALNGIGYRVIGIQIDNARVHDPDLRIWARARESSDAEAGKKCVYVGKQSV
jgi:hypothetical protein